jgi:hypothetical protein
MSVYWLRCDLSSTIINNVEGDGIEPIKIIEQQQLIIEKSMKWKLLTRKCVTNNDALLVRRRKIIKITNQKITIANPSWKRRIDVETGSHLDVLIKFASQQTATCAQYNF